ncbi:hypothetical protein L9F63_015101, partial [Diploptera punctata]
CCEECGLLLINLVNCILNVRIKMMGDPPLTIVYNIISREIFKRDKKILTLHFISP